MIDELIKLMIVQEKDLQGLLDLLETQYKMIISKDAFGLEGLIDKLNECSKIIAKEELERRKLLGENNISEIVSQASNSELTEAYGNIRNTLNKVVSKKETNEILLKQSILFNTKMLNIINPNRTIKTYNSYGALSK
jgi:flagellar biosynthesis/type III secretory pathway chaperone